MNAVKKILVALTLILATFVAVPAASAHTEIDHTTPGADSSVAAGTQTVSVVFTDKILDLADSSEVVVTAADGSEVPTSCLEVKNKSLNIEAFLGTEGDYKVTWRTVAEDGHAISGDFSFSVTGSADNADFVTCKSISESNTPVVIATPKANTPKATDDSSNNSLGWGQWLIYGGAAAGVVIGSLIRIRRRKRDEAKD